MKSVQKNMRLPKNVVDVLEREGKMKFGYNFNKYAQYILTKKAEEIMDSEETIDDPSLVEDILQARKDSKAGKLVSTKNFEEIDSLMNSLLKN